MTSMDTYFARAVGPEEIGNAREGSPTTQTLLERPVVEDQMHVPDLVNRKTHRERRLPKTWNLGKRLVGYLLLGIGLLALAASVMFTSTILAFIGLGMALWGALMFFIQPHKYVHLDLMNATARSSLKSIDQVMVGIGYTEKGVYIPTESERAVVFIPEEPFSRIPESKDIEGHTLLDAPRGLVVVPPGLALANLIEKKVGFSLKDCGIDRLIRTLPKVIIDDLEIAQRVEIKINGDLVNFKLVNNVFADFCKEISDTSRRCGLGCPMCSALACVLATATGKPVLFEEDKSGTDKKTSEPSYRIIDRSRL